MQAKEKQNTGHHFRYAIDHWETFGMSSLTMLTRQTKEELNYVLRVFFFL